MRSLFFLMDIFSSDTSDSQKDPVVFGMVFFRCRKKLLFY
jgi:hypothetical protein